MREARRWQIRFGESWNEGLLYFRAQKWFVNKHQAILGVGRF